MRLAHLTWPIAAFAGLLSIKLYMNRLNYSEPKGCAFCDPELLERQTFFVQGNAIGFYPHKPAEWGHILLKC